MESPETTMLASGAELRALADQLDPSRQAALALERAPRPAASGPR
jgi:hypothetical protein